MTVDTSTLDTRARLREMPKQELVLPVVIIALIIIGMFIRPGVFLTSDNLLNVLTQASITGIIAIGMTFVIATGGIDLSVGSVLAAASIAGGLLAQYGSWMFMLGAVGFALLLGCINGLAITWGKVVPFIATLAMLTIARGLALWMSEKTPISLIELGILQWFGSGRVLGVPVPALIFVIVSIAGWVLLNRTTFGRRTVAVGGNRSAARIAGIRPGRIIFTVYTLTGLCVGISAILLSGRLASASPVVGNLVELDAIAAVVIGGTALTGGKATVTGTFFGVITFGLIFNLLNLLNMPTEIQGIVKGLLILVAVALQRRD
ncbi:MAG TPA: ABC transporter permease [Propionibacteriaceae bacterium]|jgi:ribose transport system permease protein|nr:ABC transporter permease [Propionibacteriaceae bacterium]